MKNRMCFLLMPFVMACSMACHAQDVTVSFSYDACGNRTRRSVEFKKADDVGRSSESDDTHGWLAKVEEELGGISFSLYPNPTDGKFSLAFSGRLPSPLQTELCTSGGAVIERRQVKNLTEEFDLTGKSAGIYVLRLTSGKETQTWKIIKKN